MDYELVAEEFLSKIFKLHQEKQGLFTEGLRGETVALIYLEKMGGGVSPCEISDKMAVSSARVAVILNGLEKKGFITRRIDSDDRRQIIVDLTEDGLEQARKNFQNAKDVYVDMLQFLGEQDAEAFVRIMGRLIEFAPKIINERRWQ
ncbi:MAG: MarR family transcriptional regulator [Clostridiales bacterium]|nr:MarR family transcriptional regulator [Clostridiales bacterium]